LLFWSFLLSVYVISVLIAIANKNGELMPYVGVVLAGVQTFFLILNNFVESPFKTLATVGASGMLEHLPAWTATASTLFCSTREWSSIRQILFRLHGLSPFRLRFSRRPCLHATPAKVDSPHRKWTMIAWCFQSVAFCLARTGPTPFLGWGGYWVGILSKNASLLPGSPARLFCTA